MSKKTIIFIGIVIIFMAILALSIRGLPGNPTIDDLNTDRWRVGGPFDSSNDRGRFALTYSSLENHSFHFSLPVANFATPDLAINSAGQYVSLFAPGVSFLVMPGYVIGKYLGIAQVGSFAIIALFAFLNFLLIYLIAIRFRSNFLAAFLSALVFLFATPAFAYAVSLSQHHISSFILLLAIFILLRWRNWWSVSAIWLLCALSVVVDNPNFFLMLPIGIFALGSLVSVKSSSEEIKLKFKYFYLTAFVSMIIPISFFFWFNNVSQGSPFQLAGTLERVLTTKNDHVEEIDPLVALLKEKEAEEKTAVGFFETRNLLNGFHIHFFSRDRGIIFYTPVILLGIFGLVILYRKHLKWALLIIFTIGMNVLLYSLWGDPWGGWAFGSRYLIPSYALLAIGLGVALTHWRKSFMFLATFFILFAYSVGVNSLGALTSSANPPKVEVLALEEFTGVEQKYTYARNWQYLNQNGLKSFVWQAWAKNYISARGYYYIITSLVVVFGLSATVGLWKNFQIATDKKSQS